MRRLLSWVGERPIAVLSALFIVCVAVFLVTIPLPRVDDLLIGSDGILYYHYVHSLVIDGDLDFTNEYLHFNGPNGVPAPTPAGLPPNRMSIGMGIVWLPFFLAAHALAWLLGLPHDGYSYLYQAAVCLGSMLYGFVGILMTYRLCRQYADAVTAVVAVTLIWFGSNVIYYMVAEPSMSHMASLGVVGSFLAWWRLNEERSSARYWIGLGALGGLAALIRPQAILFMALPALQWLAEGVRLWKDRRDGQPLVAHVGRGALMGVTALAVFSIQLWAWRTIYGSVFESGYSYGDQQSFYWLNPKVFQVLFSLRHGLFTWHPIYLVGAIGLWWVAKQDRAYALLLALGLALQVYIVAAWRAWWQGDAFGGRMFISSAPIFALGLAQVVQRLYHLPGKRGAIGMACSEEKVGSAIGMACSEEKEGIARWLRIILPGSAILLWNLAFFIQYRFGYIPMLEAITLRQLVWEKFTLPIELASRLLK